MKLVAESTRVQRIISLLEAAASEGLQIDHYQTHLTEPVRSAGPFILGHELRDGIDNLVHVLKECQMSTSLDDVHG